MSRHCSSGGCKRTIAPQHKKNWKVASDGSLVYVPMLAPYRGGAK